jgi:nucleoside-diphosphate-sugar epimerase
VPTVSLRYFTVYGRAAHRHGAATHDRPDPRGSTLPAVRRRLGEPQLHHVDDASRPTSRRCSTRPTDGPQRGQRVHASHDRAARAGRREVGTPVQIERHDAAAGDARRTGGSSELARAVLGWSPTTSLTDGVRAMVTWCREAPAR